MSGIASMAIPGRIPTFSSGGKRIDPSSLFKDSGERSAYQAVLDGQTGRNIAPDVKVKKVCVKIFDLSVQSQVEEYEKLWSDLIEKTAKNEVIVEAQKDLVRRADGTSYWMKYVEYVEFGDAAEENSKPKEKNDGE